MIPYGRHCVDDEDVAAVVEVLRGDWLTQGPKVAEFEEALCEATGARYAVAFSSGTGALHAAAAAAELGGGDLVATSSLTFAASAAAALYVGARPSFLDVDPETLNLDPAAVGPEHDALIAVHYAGLPVDLRLLRTRPRVVIEDAAHALGALTPDGPVGNCAHADMSTFSFHPVKAVTAGEGGAVTTNAPDLANRLRRFRTHGMQPLPDRGGWCYEIGELGYNYRLTDLQAALGRSQLRKLTAWVDRRNDLAERYARQLAPLPVTLPPAAQPGWRHAYHLYPVRVRCRRQVYDALRGAGIGVQVHYLPVYRHPLYAPFAPGPEAFPEAEAAYAELLSIPLFPALTDDEQGCVVEALGAALA